MAMTNRKDSWEELIAAAWQARTFAYAPYSGFYVGAAVQCADGSIYSGCNIENVSYGLTNCAERTAMFQAIANGANQLKRMVICADTEEPIAPCGACRQVMVELAPQMEVLLINKEGKQIFTTVESLMPYSFSDFPKKTEDDEGDV